jgi:hypothetical protein
MKRLLPFMPFFVVIDFSSALIAAVKYVFPSAKIGHDYFHTTQLLNEGLLKEMTRLQKEAYVKPIKEIQIVFKVSLRAEKENLMDTPQLKEQCVLDAWNAYVVLFNVMKITNLAKFQSAWNELRSNPVFTQWKDAAAFINAIEDTLPTWGFTAKNLHTLSVRCGQFWRRFLRQKRKSFQDEKRGFSKVRYYILMKPDGMTAYDQQELTGGLQKYPFLQPIRTIVCQYHQCFQQMKGSKPSLSFLQTIVTKESHAKLCSAVQTLLDRQDEIFAFQQILADHPKLTAGKSIRSNHEEINKRLKLVSRNQYGLRTTPNVRVRLEGILNCPIFISEALTKKEQEVL